jgi:uncharacterized damage-inducible protein DinB
MFDHHLWATRRLIEHLESLAPERLDAEIPGTYGSIAATLTHLVDADGRYLRRMRTPTLPPSEDRPAAPLAELRSDLDDHAARWREILDELDTGDLHAAILGRDDYPDTHDAEGMLLLQAVHHGNDHRTQVCSTLGALGLEVPDLDGWEYWANGRVAG